MNKNIQKAGKLKTALRDNLKKRKQLTRKLGRGEEEQSLGVKLREQPIHKKDDKREE